jgi:hypothetical protein
MEAYPTLWPATDGGAYVVDSWRNVNSPRPSCHEYGFCIGGVGRVPEEKDAMPMPSRRINRLSKNATICVR